MKLSDVGGIAYAIVVCQFMAPWITLDLPSIRKIKVKEIKSREGRTDEYVIHKQPNGREITLHVRPELPGLKTVLKLDDKHSSGWIVLDRQTQSISSNGDHYWWQGHYGGSGDIGVVIFGLPSLIVCIPLFIVNGLVWAAVGLMTGMDRHKLSFYLRVRGQLDDYTRNLLKQALKKISH